MISVVVLTYNQEQYLAQTLDSILSQQVDEPMEIIIGDDKSTDGTSEIAKGYQEKFPNVVRWFYNRQNLGLVANFLHMLQQCRGDYCALCDGDDYWCDNFKLQKQIDIMRKETDCVLVHTHRYLLNNKVYDDAASCLLSEMEDPVRLFWGNYIAVPTVMFRMATAKSFLKQQQELTRKYDWRMQDLPLWLFLGTKGTFRYLTDATACYRVLPNTLSHETDKQRLYVFYKSIFSVYLYFYPFYAPALGKQFRWRFLEMEFHFRKRLIVYYGNLAKEQIFPLLRLLPLWPVFIARSLWRKIKRITHKTTLHMQTVSMD